jgi:predicted dehydrogenase
MHIYFRGLWRKGYLDQTPDSEYSLVEIRRQVALAPATQQFYIRGADPAMLMSYIRMLGVRRVLRKVRSRHSESARNDAWLSVGIGSVVDSCPIRRVAFVLTTGPAAAERAVVHRSLLYELPDGVLADQPIDHFVLPARTNSLPAFIRATMSDVLCLAAWHPEEGTLPNVSEATWRTIVDLVKLPPEDFTPAPSRPPPSGVRYRFDRPKTVESAGTHRPYHCFGYGQYAKTQVIPNLKERLALSCVYETNSLQIGPVTTISSHSWDTSSYPRQDDVIENAVVATYHHTHTPIAIDLIRRGVRHVIIEKPIATSTPQLVELLETLQRHPEARVHAAFQRRYSPFNEYLVQDLDGPPISMVAGVYEVPLPDRHWYRWPVVGNSIVSNGCHWIDHFLFLNGFSPVTLAKVEGLSDQLAITIELENSASSIISLRHMGSPRHGVRDFCEFWKGDASVVIEDFSRYRSERGYHRLRRATAHRYHAHEAMYREFARRVALDAPGDDIDTIDLSTRTILRLAQCLDERQ